MPIGSGAGLLAVGAVGVIELPLIGAGDIVPDDAAAGAGVEAGVAVAAGVVVEPGAVVVAGIVVAAGVVVELGVVSVRWSPLSAASGKPLSGAGPVRTGSRLAGGLVVDGAVVAEVTGAIGAGTGSVTAAGPVDVAGAGAPDEVDEPDDGIVAAEGLVGDDGPDVAVLDGGGETAGGSGAVELPMLVIGAGCTVGATTLMRAASESGVGVRVVTGGATTGMTWASLIPRWPGSGTLLGDGIDTTGEAIGDFPGETGTGFGSSIPSTTTCSASTSSMEVGRGWGLNL
jgi:hypothetical protein